MISAIIFSKNRPLQLDALLRSMRKHCDRLFKTVTVLYTADGFGDGYDRLESTYRDVVFMEQQDFQLDFIHLLYKSDRHVCLLVDDDIFFRDVDVFDLSMMMDEVDIASLRLGDNITHKSHFSYKSSLDGNIYEKNLLLNMEHDSFANPNSLESKLAKYCKDKTMGWFSESRLIGIPANKVSTTSSCADMGVSVEELNDKFMEGWEIDFEAMDFEHNNVHAEIEFKYRRC